MAHGRGCRVFLQLLVALLSTEQVALPVLSKMPSDTAFGVPSDFPAARPLSSLFFTNALELRSCSGNAPLDHSAFYFSVFYPLASEPTA